jgi:hypothetical protein
MEIAAELSDNPQLEAKGTYVRIAGKKFRKKSVRSRRVWGGRESVVFFQQVE